MPYVGQDLGDAVARMKKPTAAAARAMADKAGEEAVDWTERNTPVDEGELRASIFQKPVIVYKDARGRTVYETGAFTEVSYAPYVEYGTGLWGPSRTTYTIRARPGGWLSWITKKSFIRRDGTLVPAGTRVFAKEVTHPGSPGHFMFAIGLSMTEAGFEVAVEFLLRRWAAEAEAAFGGVL